MKLEKIIRKCYFDGFDILDSDDILGTEQRFSYDENDRIISKTTIDHDSVKKLGLPPFMSSKEEHYTYNENNDVILERFLGGNVQSEVEFIYEYNDLGQKISRLKKISSSNGGELLIEHENLEQTKYFYNDVKKIIQKTKERFTLNDGVKKISFVENINFRYDDNHNLILKRIVSEDLELKVFDETIVVYRTDDGKVIQNSYDTSTSDFKYISSGKKKVSILDNNGKTKKIEYFILDGKKDILESIDFYYYTNSHEWIDEEIV